MGGYALWRSLAPEVWERTKNPWLILHNLSQEHLLAKSAKFKAQLQALIEERQGYMESQGWFKETHAQKALQGVAYFSMEFGLGEALPLYAGGLGILAGDYFKTANDLGVPVVGMGLLFQEGYFRQVLDDRGWQQEIYPYNDPASLPIEPVLMDGRRLQIGLDLPGRTLLLRVWPAQVGKVSLYLLDSNDPLNTPIDRGITSKLYGSGPELRLMQEAILGIGGWRLLEFLDMPIDICHLNEGHAALVVLERALGFKNRYGCHFHEALVATRAGNIFTTHTLVDAGFDRYNPALLSKYFPYIHQYLDRLEIPIADLLALGRKDPNDVQGVDLWINTPRRPWEACGTSGMKVLVNGGLNLSSLDGWWNEAYSKEVGWAIGDHRAGDFDAQDAEQLYCLLEEEIVPTFYERNEEGVPVAWIARIRASMAYLAPGFSSNRMLREYVEQLYLGAAAAYHERSANGGQLAKKLCRWQKELKAHWHEIHFGNLAVYQDKQYWQFDQPVYLGGASPQAVQVQLYAEPHGQEQPVCQVMERTKSIVGAINGYFHRAGVPAKRSAADYTPRLVPHHPDAPIPSKLPYILWQR